MIEIQPSPGDHKIPVMSKGKQEQPVPMALFKETEVPIPCMDTWYHLN